MPQVQRVVVSARSDYGSSQTDNAREPHTDTEPIPSHAWPWKSTLPIRTIFLPEPPRARQGMNLPKAIDPVIDALIQPLAVRQGEVCVQVPTDVLYLLPYRELAFLTATNFEMRGFYLPKNSDVIVRWAITPAGEGWQRVIEIDMQAPDRLGAYGPIVMSYDAAEPLGRMRFARISFCETLNAAGERVKETTQIGMTFADPYTGELTKPPVLIGVMKPRLVPYGGTTLFLFDLTEKIEEMWRVKHSLLEQAQARHYRDTNVEIPVDSTANRLGFLKYTLSDGIQRAGATEGDVAAVLARIRQALRP